MHIVRGGEGDTEMLRSMDVSCPVRANRYRSIWNDDRGRGTGLPRLRFRQSS
jgi:hypothetical protein